MWVFSALQAVFYRIAPSRGQDVVREVLEGFEGTIVRDAWDAYDCLTSAKHQLDLLHANRWLQSVEARRGIRPRGLLKEEAPEFTRAGRPPREFLEFPAGVRARSRAEVEWVLGQPKASASMRSRRYRKAVRSMEEFLERPWQDEDVVRILGELGQRSEIPFTFVRSPETSWNSNEAEGEIRVAVVARKMGGGGWTARGTWYCNAC